MNVGDLLSATVPEEPPMGTVIVTANGNAFQSQVTMWGWRWVRGTAQQNPNGDVFMCTWLELIAMHGPVTIVWIPEDTPGDTPTKSD